MTKVVGVSKLLYYKRYSMQFVSKSVVFKGFQKEIVNNCQIYNNNNCSRP
jgi:hypothetical protein